MIGIDISNWQAGFDLWGAADDIDFCILKASEFGWRNGNVGIDPQFDGWASVAEERGLRIGAYMFARDTGHGSVHDQVELFVRAMGRHADRCVVCLDWEDTSYSSVQDKPWLAAEFIDELRRQTGKTPLIYTSQSVVRWGDYGGVHDMGIPLWGACYLNRNADQGIPGNTNPDLPSGGWGPWGDRPDVYQYSSTGWLRGWQLDANVSYLSEGEWDALAGGQAPTPPDPTHVDEDGYWGPRTTLAAQILLGSPYQDRIISGQFYPNWQVAYPHITEETLEFDNGSGESWLVREIQRRVGSAPDGVLGHDTISRLQARLCSKGYGYIIDPAGGCDGVAGEATCRAVQKAINDRNFI